LRLAPGTFAAASGKIGRDRVELFQRLDVAPDFSRRMGIKRLATAD